jgi:hypothetical protein
MSQGFDQNIAQCKIAVQNMLAVEIAQCRCNLQRMVLSKASTSLRYIKHLYLTQPLLL